jgi:CheY-like chemotaxis protein
MREERPVVFVIDDNPSMRDSLEDLLHSVGVEVRLFGSTQEFLQSKRPDAPGCLVLDVRLPGPSGPDFQRELAKSGIRLPIVFITGHGDIPMSVQAMNRSHRVPHQTVSRSAAARRDPDGDRAGPRPAPGRRTGRGTAGTFPLLDRARTGDHGARRHRPREQANRGRPQGERDDPGRSCERCARDRCPSSSGWPTGWAFPPKSRRRSKPK